MIWIKRIKSKRPRVVCYWNMHKVKEEKLKCSMQGRTKKTNKTMKSNKTKLKGREIKNDDYNK